MTQLTDEQFKETYVEELERSYKCEGDLYKGQPMLWPGPLKLFVDACRGDMQRWMGVLLSRESDAQDFKDTCGEIAKAPKYVQVIAWHEFNYKAPELYDPAVEQECNRILMVHAVCCDSVLWTFGVERSKEE